MDGQSASARMVLEVRDGTENPFWTNEALGEHVGSLQYALGELVAKYGLTQGDGKPDWLKEVYYHLKAINDYQQNEFQYFAALLPDVYDASDNPDAVAAMHDRLTKLAQDHQTEWEAMR